MIEIGKSQYTISGYIRVGKKYAKSFFDLNCVNYTRVLSMIVNEIREDKTYDKSTRFAQWLELLKLSKTLGKSEETKQKIVFVYK